jgi:hypothetical protein
LHLQEDNDTSISVRLGGAELKECLSASQVWPCATFFPHFSFFLCFSLLHLGLEIELPTRLQRPNLPIPLPNHQSAPFIPCCVVFLVQHDWKTASKPPAQTAPSVQAFPQPSFHYSPGRSVDAWLVVIFLHAALHFRFLKTTSSPQTLPSARLAFSATQLLPSFESCILDDSCIFSSPSLPGSPDIR